MRLFRYFDAKGGIATLRDRKIRLASPLALNDPFELTPRIEEPSDEILEERLRSDDWIREYFEQCGASRGLTEDECRSEYLTKELPRRLDEAITSKTTRTKKLKWELAVKFAQGFRMLCCSLNHDSILMWSHYADKHRGMVLEIETDELIPEVNLDPYIYEVRYRTSPPTIPALNKNIELYDSCLNEAFSTKAIQWSYEEEVRIKFPAPDGVKPDVFVERELPPSCIKRIIVGCYDDPHIGTYNAVEELTGHADYKHVQVQRAYIHHHDYKLCFADRPQSPSLESLS